MGGGGGKAENFEPETQFREQFFWYAQINFIFVSKTPYHKQCYSLKELAKKLSHYVLRSCQSGMVICSDDDDNNKVAEKTQDVNYSYLMKIALESFQYLSNDDTRK